jgi:hypothetical protein
MTMIPSSKLWWLYALILLFCNVGKSGVLDKHEDFRFQCDGFSCGYVARLCYWSGDFSMAFHYAQRGCAFNDGRACLIFTKLLWMLDRHKETEVPATKGCRLNNGESCGWIAWIHYSKNKIYDAEMAARKGCYLKDGYSCRLLADSLLERGSEDEAKHFVRKGCEYKDGMACGCFSVFLWLKGRTREAVRYAKMGCELGDRGYSCLLYTLMTRYNTEKG